MSDTSPQQVLIKTTDGVQLSMRRYRPAGMSAGAPVLLTHAMMVNGSLFERRGRGLAPWLASRGFDAFVLDFRGHGQSVPPRPGRDGWSYDDYVRFDLPAAVSEIERLTNTQHGGVGYLGHSLGGNAGIMLLASRPEHWFGRIVLMTTNFWTLRECSGLREKIARSTSMAALRSSARILRRAPIRALKMGTDDEPWPYVDQLTSWFFSSKWMSKDGTLDYGQHLHRIKTPILAIAGDGDPLCTSSDAATFVERLTNAPRRLRIVSRRAGDALDPDHFQMLTDDRLRNIWEEIARFLRGPGAAPWLEAKPSLEVPSS